MMGSELATSEYATLELELEAAELEMEAQAEAEAEANGAAGDDPSAESGDVREPSATEPSEEVLTASWQELFDRQDVEGLIERAILYRTGRGVARNLEECYQSYLAAAKLECVEAKYAIALFHLSGAVVAEDFATGLGHLRAAATAGSLRAKIYLANIYELGVGRDPEPDKADVWYRSVARGAGLEHELEDPAYLRSMAELGCIRYVRALAKSDSVGKKELYLLLGKAKALGFALHQRNKERVDVEQAAIAREIEEAMAAPREESTEDAGPAPAAAARTATTAAATRSAAETEPQGKQEPKPTDDRQAAKQPLGERLTAFFISMLCVGVAAAGGFALTAHARGLLAQGAPVPVVGAHLGLIVPLAVAAGLLPVLLVYRARTLLLAMVAAAALSVAGWVGWANAGGQLFADQLLQSQVFGLTGLVVALLVIGLLGGTRRRRWKHN